MRLRDANLSNDVHTLYFTPTTATWIKLWTTCPKDDSYDIADPYRYKPFKTSPCDSIRNLPLVSTL